MKNAGSLRVHLDTVLNFLIWLEIPFGPDRLEALSCLGDGAAPPT